MSNAETIYEDGNVVSTFAGTGHEGHRDGIKGEAQFNWPASIALDKNGDIYVADFSNNRVRKITAADGVVHTVAGTGKYGFKDGPAHKAEFQRPYGIAIGPNGDIFVSGPNNHCLRAFSPATNTVRTIADAEAGFSYPCGVAVLADGSIVVADAGNHRIVKIPAGEGVLETVAGKGHAGYADGEAPDARFDTPCGVAVSPSGDIYVADRRNHRIRKICARTGKVSTVAGTGNAGWRDGDASTFQFHDPIGVAVADDGCVYVSEAMDHIVRKLDPARERVVTIAGNGEEGFCDGSAGKSQFHRPRGMAFGHGGVLYVADADNNCIRTITPPEKLKPENEFEDLDKILRMEAQKVNKLARNIDDAKALTAAAKEQLKKAQDDVTHVTKQVAEMQSSLQDKRLNLAAIVTQWKADIEAIRRQSNKMRTVEMLHVAELNSVEAELLDTQAALQKLSREKEAYAEELLRVDTHLKRARERESTGDDSGVLGGTDGGGLEATMCEKASKAPTMRAVKEEENELSEEACSPEALKRNRSHEGDPQDEACAKKQRKPRSGQGEHDVVEPPGRTKQTAAVEVDMARKHSRSPTLQQDLDTVDATDDVDAVDDWDATMQQTQRVGHGYEGDDAAQESKRATEKRAH